MIFSAHQTMWSVTNYFLVNLTIADLLMATLNCIPSFIFMRDRYYIPYSVVTQDKEAARSFGVQLTLPTKDAAVTCLYRKSFHGHYLEKNVSHEEY